MSSYRGLELLSTAVLLLDERLHVTYANPAAETLFAHGTQAPCRRARSARRCPATRSSSSASRTRSTAEAGFNDNDLMLEVDGYPVHLHCVITPIESDGAARLVLEFRELEQQLKIAREAQASSSSSRPTAS